MVRKTIEVMYLQVTLCRGHVTAGEFNLAHFMADPTSDLTSDTELSHEYLTCTNGVYAFCERDSAGAEAFTVKDW